MALRLVYYAASRGIATLSNLDMQQCPKTFCNNVQKYFAILSKKCLQKTLLRGVAHHNLGFGRKLCKDRFLILPGYRCIFLVFQFSDPVCHCRDRYLMLCAPVPACLPAGSEFPDPFGPESGFFVFVHKIQHLQCFDGIVPKGIGG